MLLPMHLLQRVAAGEVDQAVRRWRRPTVKAGGRLRTPVGELAIDSVERVDPDQLGPEDVARCGAASVDELLGDRVDGDWYRVRFHLAGPDPRVALRSEAQLDEAERARITERLAAMDRSSRQGPWTRVTLEAIAAEPGRRAPDLAAALGWDTVWFKTQVRKLKELGLTESLEVGYRLSPRGEAFRRG